MRTFSNILARIILLLVGVVIILGAFLIIRDTVMILNDPNVGWWNFSNADSKNAMITFFLAILNVLIGITALVAVIIGKRSFWLLLFSLALLVHPVYTIVTGAMNGTLTFSWEVVGKLILQFIIPIMYFVGCLLLVKNER